MNSLISSSCDSAAEELDAGNQKPCLGAFDCCLKILGEASVAAEPGESAFYDPSSGQQHEAFCRVRPPSRVSFAAEAKFSLPKVLKSFLGQRYSHTGHLKNFLNRYRCVKTTSQGPDE